MEAERTGERARAAAVSFGRFVWGEVKATARVFAKAGGVALAVGAVGVFALVATGEHPRGGSSGVTYAVWAAASLYYAALPALVVGAAVAAWRHFGWTTALPLVVLPLMTAGAFVLGAPLIGGAARGAGEAFLAAARAYQWPAVNAFGRLAHAGPVAVPFVLAAALFDGAHLLVDGRVLAAVLKLGFVVAVCAAGAVALTVGATAPPMAWVFVRRARARWAAWQSKPAG